jgi:hypothetical protein
MRFCYLLGHFTESYVGVNKFTVWSAVIMRFHYLLGHFTESYVGVNKFTVRGIKKHFAVNRYVLITNFCKSNA